MLQYYIIEFQENGDLPFGNCIMYDWITSIIDLKKHNIT